MREEGGWQEPAEPAEPSAEPSEPARAVPPPPDSHAIDVGGQHKGKIDVTGEPPPPPVARSVHVHDGFYLRGAIGIGGVGVDFNDDSDLDADAETSHGSFALDLMIGGSPGRGLAIGGALLSEGIYATTYEHAGREIGDGNVMVGLLGGFVDGFPDPTRGFHVGGAFGIATLRAEDLVASKDTLDMAGIGGAIWFGYDFWVAGEWSLGPLVRVMATVNRDRDDDLDLTAVSRSLSLSFSALYH